MTEPTTPGAQYLQRLIRHAAATPAISAAYVGGTLAAGGADPFAELDMYLVAPPGYPAAEWLAALGGTAYLGPLPCGCQAVTPDGLTIRVLLADEPPAGVQTIFEREAPAPAAPDHAAPAAMPDLTAVAAGFWNGLYQAAAAIGRQQPFTAHGRLEACRLALAGVYRMALAPGGASAGWEGLDSLPGAGALDGLKEWLVAPLDPRAQWRSAHRLASTFESLLLPLAQRLGLAYPWEMRNLAFARLDQVRPDRPQAAAPPPPAPEPETEPARTGPARFKIKRRPPSEQ